MERTLDLIKPDAVQRGLIGDITARLESAVGMGRLPLAHLLGADTLGKQAIAARDRGVPPERAPGTGGRT